MSTQLVVTQVHAPITYNREQIDLIKKTVAKGATDDELSMFTAIAQKYDLDPLIKEIWFIKRAKKVKSWVNGKEVWDYPRLPNGEIDYKDAETIIMTSRDGYLKIAQRDDNFRGIIGFPIREGDVFEIDAEGYKVTHKFGAKRGPIIGAWAKVDHAKRSPVIVFADFKEYNSPNSTVWKQYPSAMIQKVAEVLALKRQFGISGLVTREEMATEDPSEPINVSPVAPPPKQQQPKTVIEAEVIEPGTTAGDKELEVIVGDFQPTEPETSSKTLATKPRKALHAIRSELGLNEAQFKQLLSDTCLPRIAEEFGFAAFKVNSLNDLAILDEVVIETLIRGLNTVAKQQKTTNGGLGQTVCANCHNPISDKVFKFSSERYGKGLCMDCQKTHQQGAK